MSKLTIGIIGNGFVGQATSLFKCVDIDVLMYDIVPDKCDPKGLTLLNIVNRSDIIIICVPTPMKESGECETGIVESCIRDIRSINPSESKNIVVRSTVPVGFCNLHGVHHMPEFLTEANWKDDFKKCEMWVVGIYDNDLKFKEIIKSVIEIAKLYGKISQNTIEFVDTDTSEFVKYGRNCFLAVKLSLCNEYFNFCENKKIDYKRAINIVGNDRRIGNLYTNVPGPDGKRGWSGTCLPKDMTSFLYQFNESNVSSYIIKSAIKRNNECDRIDQDWKNKSNKGRTFV